MTPMQMLKNNFDILSHNLSANFAESNLNKAQPREKTVQKVDDNYLLSFPDEDTNFEVFNKKEVKSDFIKIFKAKTKQENHSIGFHFVYIDKEPSDFRIQVSLKTIDKNTDNENFNISEKMTLDTFKEKLNLLNQKTILNNDVANVISEVIKLLPVNKKVAKNKMKA